MPDSPVAPEYGGEGVGMPGPNAPTSDTEYDTEDDADGPAHLRRERLRRGHAVSGSERLDPNPGVTIGGSGAHAVGNGYTDSGDQLNVEETSLGEIVGRLASDFSRLMRAEIALAKAEAKEEVKEAGKGAGMLAGAGYAGHLLVLFLSLALMFPWTSGCRRLGGADRRRDLGDRRVRPVLLRPQEPQARHAPHGRDRRDLEGGRPMGEETARLRAEIDQTRDDLTRDVDLLAEKTSPSKIVERRVESTKRGSPDSRTR